MPHTSDRLLLVGAKLHIQLKEKHKQLAAALCKHHWYTRRRSPATSQPLEVKDFLHGCAPSALRQTSRRRPSGIATHALQALVEALAEGQWLEDVRQRTSCKLWLKPSQPKVNGQHHPRSVQMLLKLRPTTMSAGHTWHPDLVSSGRSDLCRLLGSVTPCKQTQCLQAARQRDA